MRQQATPTSKRERKAARRAAIRERAAEAIRDLYHNATPNYPRNVPEEQQKHFQHWFDDSASQEIEYLNDGGAYGPNYRATLAAPCNAGRYTSAKARDYYIRSKLRAQSRERARCNSLDSRDANTNAEWERAREQFGKIYTYGRGGRTVAPSDLVKTRGGNSFSPKEDYFDESSMADVIDGIRIIESFNRHVESWNAGVADMWKEHYSELWAEESRDAGFHQFHSEGGAFGSFEVFHNDSELEEEDGTESARGWYWHSCFAGCLPDSDAFGPFESSTEAKEDADNSGT